MAALALENLKEILALNPTVLPPPLAPPVQLTVHASGILSFYGTGSLKKTSPRMGFSWLPMAFSLPCWPLCGRSHLTLLLRRVGAFTAPWGPVYSHSESTGPTLAVPDLMVNSPCCWQHHLACWHYQPCQLLPAAVFSPRLRLPTSYVLDPSALLARDACVKQKMETISPLLNIENFKKN